MEIASIVEGACEEVALPVLLRRLLVEIDPSIGWSIRIHPPIRRPKDLLATQDFLAATVDLAARQLGGPGAVLVVVDADDECPATWGPRLREWAQAARRDRSVSVVLANCEYEAWFVAAAESLQGHRGMAADIAAPDDPEAISGAKEWLSRRMPRNQPYSPMSHQASFSATMDLALARQRSSSFRKLCRDVERLVTEMRAAEA